MLSKNQMSMFLKTQMLCIIVNGALMPCFRSLVFGFKVRLKVKEIDIWNLSNAILSKFNFLTALNNKIKLLFQQSKNADLSNREVWTQRQH